MIVTHTKAAKSVDVSIEGNFEFMWQLKLVFDYGMRDLRTVSLKITEVQTSARFSKQKDLHHAVKIFNSINHSDVLIKKKNFKKEFAMRKKLRQKLRKIPKSDLVNPILRKDCTLLVKGFFSCPSITDLFFQSSKQRIFRIKEQEH